MNLEEKKTLELNSIDFNFLDENSFLELLRKDYQDRIQEK